MHCPACNAENGEDASRCGSCGGPLGRKNRKSRVRAVAEEADTPFAGRPGGPNRPAILAYRICVAGLIPGLGLVLGPAALVLGSVARRKGAATPGFTAEGPARAAVWLGAAITLTNWLGLALMVLGLREHLQ
jgi:hypothetical protein